MTEVDRIREWTRQVKSDERACTIEQCLDRIDRLLALVAESAPARKPPVRAPGRAVKREHGARLKRPAPRGA
jgi:hypothetical protein